MVVRLLVGELVVVLLVVGGLLVVRSVVGRLILIDSGGGSRSHRRGSSCHRAAAEHQRPAPQPHARWPRGPAAPPAAPAAATATAVAATAAASAEAVAKGEVAAAAPAAAAAVWNVLLQLRQEVAPPRCRHGNRRCPLPKTGGGQVLSTCDYDRRDIRSRRPWPWTVGERRRLSPTAAPCRPRHSHRPRRQKQPQPNGCRGARTSLISYPPVGTAAARKAAWQSG